MKLHWSLQFFSYFDLKPSEEANLIKVYVITKKYEPFYIQRRSVTQIYSSLQFIISTSLYQLEPTALIEHLYTTKTRI